MGLSLRFLSCGSMFEVVFIFTGNIYILKVRVVCMKKLECLIVLMFVLVSSFVVAGISLSEPLDIYNLGDRLYISADGIIGSEYGNLNVDLVCGNRTTNLERTPAKKYDSGEALSYSLPYVILTLDDLEIVNLSEIVGSCQVVVSLGTNVISTKVFTISDDVAVSVSLDKAAYNPGEGITVKIEAIKANGQLLNGFVEGSNITSFSKAIDGGYVSEVFSTSDTIEAGNYYLNVRAYDTGRSGILNEGSAGIGFSINHVASSLVMSLSVLVLGLKFMTSLGLRWMGLLMLNLFRQMSRSLG